jgi:hypothetical protein
MDRAGQSISKAAADVEAGMLHEDAEVAELAIFWRTCRITSRWL